MSAESNVSDRFDVLIPVRASVMKLLEALSNAGLLVHPGIEWEDHPDGALLHVRGDVEPGQLPIDRRTPFTRKGFNLREGK